MREIKFSGLHKTADNDGGWIYGLPTIRHDGKIFIQETESGYGQDGLEIYPETLRQFTGLHDKNGKEIYEGDVVKYLEGEQQKDNFHEYQSKVYYNDGSFMCGSIPLSNWTHYGDKKLLWNKYRTAGSLIGGDLFYEQKDIEIIGNIYENPELCQ